MNDHRFPPLEAAVLGATRDALHAYAQVIGGWAEHHRQRRKHWWHISLRPSLRGLTTGVVRAAPDFELALDLAGSRIRVGHERGTASLDLCGQSAREIATFVHRQLTLAGLEDCAVPEASTFSDASHPDYSVRVARDLHRAIASIADAMEDFRAGIREETSPIQVWPHHFDLAMVWLPGTRIAGQDPADEEHADKQMNFGFLFGDSLVAEPYFYVTAHPHAAALEQVALPAGAEWHVDGFKGAVLKYRDLLTQPAPAARLLELWGTLHRAGGEHLCD